MKITCVSIAISTIDLELGPQAYIDMTNVIVPVNIMRNITGQTITVALTFNYIAAFSTNAHNIDLMFSYHKMFECYIVITCRCSLLYYILS